MECTFDSDELTSSGIFSPTEQIRSYCEINTKNLECYEHIVDLILNEVEVKGDPWKYFKDLNSDAVLLKEQNRKLFVDIKACEADLKLYLNKISLECDEIEDTKEQINECAKLLKDLSLAKDDSHKKTKDKHNAYKHTIQYYKDNLDLYVHAEKDNENSFCIKLCFFTRKFDDTYSITFLKSDKEEWNLVNINPKITDCQFIALKKRLEETKNISAFVCTVRRIFSLLKSK